MRKCIFGVTALLLVVAGVGCARLEINKANLSTHIQLNQLRPGPYETKRHFSESRWLHYFLFQLTPTVNPNLEEIIHPYVKPGEFVTDLEIKKEISFPNGLICLLIGIIYCPETLTVEGNVVARVAPVVSDSDGDGVIDDFDKCPDTPKGVKVDENGCEVSSDSDNDGVLDDLDKCPGTPAGTKVDENGCPVTVDSDGDGVSDDYDKCPDTPPRTPVDENGCPKSARFRGVLKGVEFEHNSTKLTPASKKILDAVAEEVNTFPHASVEIQGHTDNIGNKTKNQILSQQRADAVVSYLVKRGVNRDRLMARGYGSSKPITSNKTKAGQKANRRVELKWLD